PRPTPFPYTTLFRSEAPQETPEPQKTQEAQEKNEYRYKSEDVDWNYLAQFGINKETLEKDGQLDLLLKGYKTNKVYPTSVNFGRSEEHTSELQSREN